MDTTSKTHFTSALIQGLAVGLFLYAVIFTVAILKGASVTSTALLASAEISIARDTVAVTETVPKPLQPEDQVAPPEPTPVAETATVEPVGETLVQQISAIPQDMIESTPQGPLPKKSASGATPFHTYKKAFTDPGRPVVAIAVLNYGLSESDSKDALKKLPAYVSMILNPYAQNFDTWKSLAQADGREFWVYVPIENQVYPITDDPGPQALLAHSDFKYNQEKFYWALSRTSGYAGVAGYTDAAFLNAQSVLKTLWDDGYNRGLAYFEVNPTGLEGVEMNAMEKKAPYVRNGALYDPIKQTPEEWLASLEQEASNNGFAIGVIRTPYPAVVDAVATWSGTLKDRGFALGPVSALVQINNSPASETPLPVAAPAVDHHAAP